MVTKYSEDAPPVARRVKVYSRIAPLVSNPTYCRTTITHKDPPFRKGNSRKCELRSLLTWIERFRKSNKRGTSMMAHLCVSVHDHLQSRRSISRRKLAFYLCSQEFPVQTNDPEAGCPRYAPHARSTGARSYRTSRHSLKLSLSESQVPVPIGTTLSAARSRRESKQHHAHRLAPYGQH